MRVTKNVHVNNIDRFNGFADQYDKFRPIPPHVIVEVLTQYIRKTPSLVADLGCGTGLSTFIWQANSKSVVGIDPNREMLEEAIKKCNQMEITNTAYQFGYGNDTNLETNSVDIVTCSSSFHWMEPKSTIKEVLRILKDTGVFAIYQHDHPSGIDWVVEKAYSDLLFNIYSILDNTREDNKVRLWTMNEYIETMKSSGEFGFMKEIVFHKAIELNAEEYIGLFFSQGAVQDVLKLNIESINNQINQFVVLANERLGRETFQAIYGYRLRLAIKNTSLT